MKKTKITLATSDLLKAIQTTQNVVTSRTTLPILSTALLRATKTRLTVSATDLDVGISASIKAEAEEAVSVAIPAKRLLAIARELPDSEVTIEVDARHHAVIRSGTAYFKVMGLPEEEFPAFQKTTGAKFISLPQDAFRDGLKMVSHAMSEDESRYVLNGVLLQFTEKELTLVATDGRRLAKTSETLNLPAGLGEFQVILPTKAVVELQRVLGIQENVTIALLENSLVIDAGEVIVYSKLIDGKYPNYAQVIPTKVNERVGMDRFQVIAALQRVIVMVDDKGSSVKLTFSKGRLEFRSEAADIGESKESVVTDYKGKDFEIAFSPFFLLDTLKAAPGQTVTIELVDPKSPGVIRGEKSPFLGIVMPMRVD